ncbi:MAG TPA: hypothetical protein VGR95_23575 [Thermoanaerobaculia bacterium]|nr:hypothetical protein [Thermoanaerobaculia bacterium]
MIRRNASFAVVATAAALLLLAGCGTYQDTYGYPQQQQPYTNTIHGTVDYVDTASHSIVLYDTSGYGTMLSGSGYPSNSGSVRVYYDNRTGVSWQGRSYRPADLQRGDQVDVTVYQSGNQLIAESANVTYNANTANNPYPSNSYPNNQYPNQYPNSPYPSTTQSSLIRGTIRYVDTNSRTISIDTNNGLMTVSYDRGLRVDVNGQLYPVTNLERGDVIDVQTQGYSNSNNLFASRITLVRDVRR